MSDSMRTILQYLLFVGLLCVGLAPFVMMMMRNSAMRQRFAGCSLTNCWAWCQSRRVHYDAADLRTLQELEEEPQRRNVGITGAYRMYQARRSRLSLRLASWHEDVKKVRGRDVKLAQLQRTSSTYVNETPNSRASNMHGNIPFDIHVVEVNDYAHDDSSSADEQPVVTMYQLANTTPTAKSTTACGLEPSFRREDDEEEKEESRDDQIV